ncbi:amine oxidase (plasmid) [Solidesulfovibrio carbinoliphilus subsp. oakridgensis]|uniref:Amine oxidase n=1 Tax=Solidesulfovibrio carbinoliphilus subsp. oakridgensis TaxID=694327 RepID=G7QEA3_9BACT|nr:FAD-dependent oxidoreductase [Solidesulfovibrio carbinoliphilus]EHJ45997.1 amine oxidase [Solidesulfovibrio carbinoliphilus subsp. oakridgensis]
MNARPVVIVGGGVAGLACAVTLAEAGRPVVVLEKEGQVGGLLRSCILDGVTFDLGPHVLFLDGPGRGETFLRAVLAGEPCLRRAFAFAVDAGGRLWNFPNHLDIFRYPLKFQVEALRAAWAGGRGAPPEPVSAARELAAKCGPSLYALLFRDLFAKKTLLSPDDLHRHWLMRPDRTIRNGNEPRPPRGRQPAVLAVLRSLRRAYAYPLGGLGEVPRILADRIRAAGGEIRTGVGAVGLVRDGRRVAAVTVAGGRPPLPVGELVWTAPLRGLTAALGAAAPGLPTVTLRLALLTYARTRRLPRPHVYTYHPDPALAANRVYYPESIFRERGPADREGLCLEVNLPGEGDGGDAPTEAETLTRAVADVERLGLYPRSALRAARAVTLPAAMPVYPLDYEARLAAATAPVRECDNVHAVGRQGGFFFCLAPAAAAQGLKMAAHLLAKPSGPGA